MNEGENSTQNNTSDLASARGNNSQEKSTSGVISWTASDAIDHSRSGKWYFGVFAIVLALGILLTVLVIIKFMTLFMAISSGVLILLILITILMSNKTAARELSYQLDENGLTIDQKTYNLSEFRAFGVRKFGATWQLVLLPVKRFGMSLTAFIHEEQGEQIVDFLGARLPMEEVKFDLVDKLAQKLKI